MANVQSVIDIVFNGIDNASPEIKKITDALGDFGDGAQTIAEPFSDLADTLLKFEGSVLALGAAFAALAVNEAVKFETSLLGLQKQMKDNEGSAKEFSAVLEDLAITYGTNANELVDSVADFKAANFDLNASVALTELALKTMIAGEVSAAQATEILKNSLSGFGIENDKAVESATRIADVLNKIADMSSGGFQQLALGFAQLAPIAQKTGQSFEQVAATLSVVIDNGKTGSEAAVGLQTAYLSLIKPVGEAEKAMAALGVAFDAAGKPIGSVQDIITTMLPKWASLTQEQKLFTAATIVGEAQAGIFVTVMEEQAKVMERVKAATEDAGGSIDKEVVIRLKSAAVQIAATKEAWRQFMATIGAEILEGDALTDLFQNITGLSKAFRDVAKEGGFKPLVELLQSQFSDIGDLIEAIAKNLPEAFEGLDWSGLIDALKGLEGEVVNIFKAFFGNIDLTTVEGLQNALQTIINTFESLTIAVTGIVQELKPFFAGLGAVIQKFDELDDVSKLEFGQTLGAMKLITDVGTGLGLVLIGIGRAGLDMSAAMDAAFGAVKIGINAFQSAFDAASLFVVNFAKNIVEALLKVADSLGADEIADQLRKGLGELNTYSDAITENLNKNSGELKAGWDQAAKGLSELGGASSDARAKLDASEAALRKTGQAAKDSGEAWQDWSDGLIQANELVKKNKDYVNAAEGQLMDWSDGLKGAKKATIEWVDSFKFPKVELPEGVKKLTAQFTEGSKQAGIYATSVDGVAIAYTGIGKGTVKATGAFAAVADKTKDAKDQLDALTKGGKLTVEQLTEVTKTANDFQVKMEEIASNERIKTIEARVNLNIAGLEADVKRVQSAFASIDNTVSSTGDLLGSLFGNLTDTENQWDKWKIEDQIDLENKRRQEALDMQKKLVEAEIARIEAQTRVMERGDPWIKIDGTGLAPQLEAFMWEILKAIRTQVNAEFADFLLGVGVTA